MSKLASSTLATRFVNAYNLLDHSLRQQYNFKTNISFSDLIRRTASLNQIIRLYEDELIDLARLRNAIIHSKSEEIIAEPHEKVVKIMEKVARIISTPPLVVDVIKSVKVDTINAESCLKNYVIYSSQVGHSNIPVYKRNLLIGVLQRHYFLETLGHTMSATDGVDDYLTNTSIEQYLRDYPKTDHFIIVSARVTIEEIIELFSNRKLSSVIITDSGTNSGNLIGIITQADIIYLMNIIEGY